MFLECTYFSFVLGRNTTINVVIPTPTGNEQIVDSNGKSGFAYEEGLPVVYLLHGAYGNESSWPRFSSVERAAEKHRCMLVMCGAGNSFYQDMAVGDKWKTYFTEELPEYITRLFPASKDREKTFIAGFSMGGYGAYYLALTRPDLYGKTASMSGALDICNLFGASQASVFRRQAIFGDVEDLKGTQADLFALFEKDKAAGCVPQMYMACGTEDFLYQMNLDAKARFEKMGADLTYEEGPGGHEWDFWDVYIRHILDWMMPQQ